MAKKELVNIELQEAAKKSEQNRLTVERIESLQKSSDSTRKIIILNAIAAGLFALSALLRIPKAIDAGFEFGKSLNLYSNALCSVIWGIIGRMNYKEKKNKDNEIELLTKQVLRTNK